MTEPKAKRGRPKKNIVKVGGKISNGEGGFFEKGDELPNGPNIESLREQGLVE